MVQKAETEFSEGKVIPLDVQLFDCVVDVVSQIEVRGTWVAALVLIGRNIESIGLESAKAVSGNDLRGALSFSDFHTNVVVFGALFSQETDSAPVEVV